MRDWEKQLKDKAVDTIVVHYRDVSDFDQDTLVWRVIDAKAGVSGLFGKLVHAAAPIDYKGEDYAVMFQFEKKTWTTDKAIDWVKTSNYKVDKFDVVDIDGVEVLKEGKWNGDDYSQKDFKDMIEAFEAGVYNGAAKFGHNNTQKALKEFLDGMPRFGSTKRLYVDGGSLRVDFKNVPRKLAMLLEVGAFPIKSAEIYFNYPFGGKRYRRVFKAVAFFGDNMPACEGLDDVIKIYEPEVKAASSQESVEFKIYTEDVKNYMKHTKMWHDCVSKVAARGDVSSPEAVCTWSLNRTGNVYMKKADDPEPELKKNSKIIISRDEMKMIDPAYADHMAENGIIGCVMDLDNGYEITPIMGEKNGGEYTMTPEEQKKVDDAIKGREEAEKKLKVEQDEKAKVLKEKQDKEAELKAIRETATNTEILSKIEVMLKSKIKSESVDAFVTVYKALAELGKVACYSLKEGKIVKGEDAELKDMFLKFIDSIPENPEVVKFFKEQADNKGSVDFKAKEAAGIENVELSQKVDAYLKEHKLEKTVANMKAAREALLKK